MPRDHIVFLPPGLFMLIPQSNPWGSRCGQPVSGKDVNQAYVGVPRSVWLACQLNYNLCTRSHPCGIVNVFCPQGGDAFLPTESRQPWPSSSRTLPASAPQGLRLLTAWWAGPHSTLNKHNFSVAFSQLGHFRPCREKLDLQVLGRMQSSEWSPSWTPRSKASINTKHQFHEFFMLFT